MFQMIVFLTFYFLTLIDATKTGNTNTNTLDDVSDTTSNNKQYCIVGAGPGGIQLGHFMKTDGRDYIIFEMNPTAGSFFKTFPKQRKLISINKRFRGEPMTDDRNREITETFAMRHDWNSLLGNATPPVTERTRDLYPSADVLYEYLQDFAVGQNIMFNTKVVNIEQVEKDEVEEVEKTTPTIPSMFQITTVSTTKDDTSKKVWTCQHLIMANGIAIPNTPEFHGHEDVLDYVNLPRNGSWADGYRVLVLGLGNAALEAAKSVEGWATETTVMGRPQPLPSPWRKGASKEGLRFSYHTHYVGDMRQINLNIMDMYQLKSLDGKYLFMEHCVNGRR